MDNLFSIEGKVALVTGGTNGIGLMIATGFVKAGAKVYVASRKAEACEATAKALSEFGTCIGIPADLSTEEGCVALADTIKEKEGKLNILVNNAGATWGAPIDQYPDKAWDRILNLNVKGVFHLTKQLLPILKEAGSGEDPARVINISSVAGQLTGSMQAYAYGPSKAAVNQLTRTLANELAAHSITVNAIAPGFFPSKMTDYILVDDEAEKNLGATMPLKRIGKPEDMQGLSIFLCSQAGSYITGTIIPLDGGSLVKG